MSEESRKYFWLFKLLVHQNISFFISLGFRPKNIGSNVHIYHKCTLALLGNSLCTPEISSKTAMKSRLVYRGHMRDTSQYKITCN